MSRLKRDLILSAIDVTREKRDAAISTLIKAETKLRELRKQLERFDRRMARLRTQMTRDPADVLSPPVDDLSIPDFLKRDAAVKAQIVQEQAERKRTKAQVRIEKMKAKQSGETRKVPLTGRDALRFIKECGS